jgi:hypothetical protein
MFKIREKTAPCQHQQPFKCPNINLHANNLAAVTKLPNETQESPPIGQYTLSTGMLASTMAAAIPSADNATTTSRILRRRDTEGTLGWRTATTSSLLQKMERVTNMSRRETTAMERRVSGEWVEACLPWPREMAREERTQERRSMAWWDFLVSSLFFFSRPVLNIVCCFEVYNIAQVHLMFSVMTTGQEDK